MNAGVVLCSACGHGLLAGDAYCEVCGAPSAWAPPARSEQHGPGFAVVSDIGLRRPRNEDAFAVVTHDERVAVVVCDGVSSSPDAARAAVLASRAAGEVLARGIATPLPDPEAAAAVLRAAVAAAQEAVSGLAATTARAGAPSTTLVAAVVVPGGAVLTSVGDSRGYWLPDHDVPRLVTVDDTEPAALLSVRASSGEAAGLPLSRRITRWIGADDEGPTPQTYPLSTASGVLVLCTDGLWQYVAEPVDLAFALGPGLSAQPAHAHALVDLANAAGGGDNVTVALLAVPATGGG